jgi:O-methyltransferase
MFQPPSLIDQPHINRMCVIAWNAPQQGCFVEVGVYQGGSALHLARIAEEQKRPLYLYDTFTGIPYQGELDPHAVGDFNETEYELVRDLIPYATVVQGIFPQSMVEMGPVAFAHIDVDQYQSYKEAFEVLVPLMVRGGAMILDDYGHLPGATAAADEFFGKDRIIHYPYTKALIQF